MKKGEKKTPEIYNDPLAVMTPEEKQRARSILVDPVYVKLMRIVERYKPSSNCAMAGSGTRDDFSNDRANARLGEIRGWEFHIAAIYRHLSDAPQAKEEVQARYPDSGTMHLEPQLPKK